MSRALAHVETVVDIQPIVGADRIEYVTVLGWHVIQAKDTVKVGDKVVYIEIDSRVPSDNEAFEFLAKRDYKVKTMKMRGVVSQGLIVTFESLGLNADKYEVGQDLTKELGIVKIETQEEKDLKRAERASMDAAVMSMKARHKKFFQNKFIKRLMKHKWFRKFIFAIFGKKSDKPREFPKFIEKTDEVRIENIPAVLGDKTKSYVVTEKIDGTSTTFAVKKKGKKYEFIVCSRNVRQADVNQACYHECGNVYWEMAFKYDIKNVLTSIAKEFNQEIVILQGETIGLVQGNPYKLEANDFYGYNLIFTDAQKSFYKKFESTEAAAIVAEYGVKWVPFVSTEFYVPDTMEEMKALADGKSQINPAVIREGIVCRHTGIDNKVDFSFKNVSNQFLIKKAKHE